MRWEVGRDKMVSGCGLSGMSLDDDKWDHVATTLQLLSLQKVKVKSLLTVIAKTKDQVFINCNCNKQKLKVKRFKHNFSK